MLFKEKKKDSVKRQRKCQKLTILELSNRDCKITMIMLFKYVKVSNGKSRQHARVDGQYKERKKNKKKKTKLNVRISTKECIGWVHQQVGHD